MRQRLLHGAALGGRIVMAIAVLWLGFGLVAPSTRPGSSSQATTRNISNMDFGGLVSTFLWGVALVVASILAGLLVARFWPKGPASTGDE